jgi:hypothetical protein
MDEAKAFLWLQVNQDEADDDAQAAQAVFGASVAMIAHYHQERAWLLSSRHTYLVWANLLPNPCFGTPWQQLYWSKSNRAFLTTMGFDVATFQAILEAGFAQRWCTTPIPCPDVNPAGQTRLNGRSIDAPTALGLVLHYLSSTVHEVALQEIFAVVPTSTSRYITFGLKIFLATLREMPDAKISWPKGDEFQHLNNLIRDRHPRLTGALTSIDSLNLPVQTSGNQDIENASYNGWLHDHFVSSVLVFAPNGMLRSVDATTHH